MNSHAEPIKQRQGFEGAILGLPLADVLQLKQQNRFSGCVTVTNVDRQGRLFFRNGLVIHAELPECEGEDACYRMLAWSGGQFKLEPRVDTTRHTIDKPLSYLLLEACRLMDENLLVQEEPPAKVPATGDMSDYIASLLGAFNAVPEVCRAVVTNRKGQLQYSDNPQKKKLATDGEFLSLIGRRLGQLLSVGELHQAAFSSKQQQVISVRNRSQALHVSFGSGQSLAGSMKIVRSILKSIKKA
jgi:hypothetical protein